MNLRSSSSCSFELGSYTRKSVMVPALFIWKSRLRSGCVETSDMGVLSGSLTVSHSCLTRSSVKEVIQPQVPLRLPCYDFVPVMLLAFVRLAPCGFRHGLRALTTSMA